MKTARLVGGAALVCGVLWGSAWLAARALIVHEPLDHADAIVVLAGSKASLERTQRAALLFRRGLAPSILLTNDGQQGGWSNREERNPYFIEGSVAELVRQGVPPTNIEVLPYHVSSTHDEAVALHRYSTEHHLRRLLLVTSAYHSRRALWVFRRVLQKDGIVVGIDPVEPGQQTPRPSVWWLTLGGWRDVAEEYVKLGFYLVRYR